MTDCICEGNWRTLVRESDMLLDETFISMNGKSYTFFGIVHGKDDYYYGMVDQETHKISLLSCVGSLSGYGFTQKV